MGIRRRPAEFVLGWMLKLLLLLLYCIVYSLVNIIDSKS